MSDVFRRVLLRALVIFGLLLSGVLFYAVTVPIEIRQPLSDETVVDLRPDEQVGQSFIANFSGLNRISLRAERVPAGSLDDLEFRLLVGMPGEERLLLDERNVSFQLERGWLHIQFPPQQYETPQRVVFYLSSKSSEVIRLRAHSENMYPQGIRLNTFGDLTFEAGFRPSAEKALSVMLSRLKSNKPGLAGSGWVYLFSLIAFTASLSMLVESCLVAPTSMKLRGCLDQATPKVNSTENYPL